jgi:hypothetical protein
LPWHEIGADAVVMTTAFLPTALAGLYFNDFYYRWCQWRNEPWPSRPLVANLLSLLLWMLLLNGLPIFFFFGMCAEAFQRASDTVPIGTHAFLASISVAVPLFILTTIGHAQWYAHRTRRAPRPQQTSDRLTLADAALSKQQRLVPDGTIRIVPWGGLLIPVLRSLAHFACVGVTRSGKTTIIRLMMQAILPWLFAGHFAVRGRAVIFDPKTEFVPILCGMGVPQETILIMHPLDRRCVPWDIAADTRAKGDCDSIAAVLVPDRNRENQFWIESVRDVVASVLWALHLGWGDDWTFRHFMLVLADFSKVERLLDQHEDTRHIIPSYCGNRETYGNVIATIRSMVRNFETVAACWHYASEKPISLDQWVHSNSILLLGHDDGHATTLQTLNRCLVRKIVNVLLAPGRSVDPELDRTWLFLDETRDLGKLPGTREILTRGAGKGCSAVLGFQSVMGMREVFGQNEASEIVGQCENIAISSLGNDQDTAEWAAKLIGRYEKRELTRSESFSPRTGNSTGTSESIQERYYVRPDTLQTLPDTNPQNGLHGYFLSKAYGVVDASQLRISGAELFGRQLDPPDAEALAFDPVPPEWHVLAPWTPEERAKFAILFDDAEEQHSTDILPAWLWQVAKEFRHPNGRKSRT